MTLDDIHDAWGVDSKIDRSNLHEESLRIPQLHHEWRKRYSLERRELSLLHVELKKLRLDKRHKLAATRLLKQDISDLVDIDSEVVDATLLVGDQQEKYDLITDILKTIANRSFHIADAIAFMKFTAGVDGGGRR